VPPPRPPWSLVPAHRFRIAPPGELGRAGRSPEEAFRRYERLLHPFMLSKQNAAEKFANSFAPKTRLGLFVRNQVTKVLGVPFVGRRVMGSTLLDPIDLPDYVKTAQAVT
jgi:hypothetical protein